MASTGDSMAEAGVGTVVDLIEVVDVASEDEGAGSESLLEHSFSCKITMPSFILFVSIQICSFPFAVAEVLRVTK